MTNVVPTPIVKCKKEIIEEVKYRLRGWKMFNWYKKISTEKLEETIIVEVANPGSSLPLRVIVNGVEYIPS